MTGCTLCNDALLLSQVNPIDQNRVLGDPTETALVVVADRLGFAKAILEQSFPRVGEIPFDATRKCMTTIHRVMQPQDSAFDRAPGLPTPYIAFTKGAVSNVLDLSSHVWVQGHVEPLQGEWRDRILASNSALAATGMRVLGVACRWLETVPVGQARAVEQESGLYWPGWYVRPNPCGSEAGGRNL